MITEGCEYFEEGCLCYLSGKIEKGSSYQYYYDNCTCSRHPESSTRPCWDKDKEARRKALEVIKERHPNLWDRQKR